jgi:predicted Zn-dependent protease
MIVLTSVALLALGSAVGSEIAADEVAAPGALPSVACVKRVREARIAWKTGSPDGALVALDDAVTACPGDLEPLLLRVEIERFLGRDEAVAADLVRIRTRLGNDQSPVSLGSLVRAILDPRMAPSELEPIRTALEARLTTPPLADERRVRRALAAVCGRLGEIDAARAALEPLLASEPSADERWAAAELELEAECWSAAIEQLEALLRESSELANPVRLLLTEAYAGAGRFEEVVRVARDLQAAGGIWSVSSHLVDALLNAAWTARDAGQSATSRRLFEAVLEIEPDNEPAHEAIVNLYAGLEGRRAAAAAKQQELADEEDPEVLLEQGSRLLATGDAAGAVEALRRAAAALPEDPVAWSNLGVAAIRLEDWPQAAEALQRAVALEPEVTSTRLNLGTALARLDRCDEALATLTPLVAAHPELWQAEYWRWLCLQRLGQAAEAAAALARYQAGGGP